MYEKKTKIFRFFVYIFGFILFAWFARLIMIFPWTQDKLIYSDPLTPCELIVVLGGEYYERINYAFDLAEQGYASRIFAPSLGYTETRRLAMKRSQQNNGLIDFFDGGGASSTYKEAVLTKAFIRDNNISSFILVTSSYHSYRAHWIFKKIMADIKIISFPVKNNTKKISNYFRAEQFKFLWYYLLYSLR